ncbi:hypothetical protein PYCC9005_004967 [Savitreella phatthalungensis]
MNMDVEQLFREKSVAECRTLEVELRAEAARKKTDLRLLVGDSYRDLLRTADLIVSVRQSTRRLKQEISNLGEVTTDESIRKAERNLSALRKNDEEAVQSIRQTFLQDSRALVVQYCRRGDLSTAALIWKLAARMNASDRRVIAAGRVLRNALEQCDQMRTFACAHCIYTGQDAPAAQRHFFIRQLERARECDDVISLSKRLIKLIDDSADIASVKSELERYTDRPLVEVVSALPDVDSSLAKALPKLGKMVLAVSLDDISSRQARREAERLLRTAGETLTEVIGAVFERSKSLAIAISHLRDIRRLLDEHGLEDIYPNFEQAIRGYVLAVANSRATQLSEAREATQAASGDQEDIWSRRINWRRQDLIEKQRAAAAVVRGSADTQNFERRLREIAHEVDTDLATLLASRTLAALADEYRLIFDAACQTMLASIQGEQNNSRAHRLTRIVRQILKKGSTTYLLLVKYEVDPFPHVTQISKATFDGDKPVLPSAECLSWLSTQQDKWHSAGLDLLRSSERRELGQRLQDALPADVNVETEETAATLQTAFDVAFVRSLTDQSLETPAQYAARFASLHA